MLLHKFQNIIKQTFELFQETSLLLAVLLGAENSCFAWRLKGFFDLEELKMRTSRVEVDVSHVAWRVSHILDKDT